MSYAELCHKVVQLASFLVQLDPEPHSRVALGAKNSVDHVTAILAVLAAHKIWVPINPRNGDNEILRAIETVAPTIALLDGDMFDRIGVSVPNKLLLGGRESQSAISQSSKLEPLEELLPYPALDEVQAIKFTGGTTGAPKGSMQSYRCWNAKIVNQLHAFKFNENDRFLATTPLTHGASTFLMPIFAGGGAAAVTADTTPSAILDAIDRWGITTLFMPPTQLTAVTDEAEHLGKRPTSLRNIVYGAAPMRVDRIRQAQSVFGPVIAASYGQAEAPQVISIATPIQLMDDANVASVGRPALLNKVAILNDSGGFAKTGEQGEVVVHGDLVTNGYWKLAELTAKTIVDGWLHTGDVGFLDERGYLFLRDRKKEVIISGGFNVYPSDVETVLSRHPSVAFCAVFGMPDDKWGEAVHAAVELRDGMTLDPSETIKSIKNQIGSVQAPKCIHILDVLPRSPVGKILKTEIVSQLLQMSEPGSIND